MGSTSIQTSSGSTQQATPTPEEQAMQRTQLAQYQQYAPAQTQMFNNAFSLGNQLLTSFGDKQSNMWQSLIGGVTQPQQNSMVQQSNMSLMPQLQSSGIMDSGTAASVMGRSSADLYNQNAQFNVGALQNALNLALSGQAQVQSPAMGATSQLASQLAGLRTNTTTGNVNQTSNPFMQSLYSSLGSSLGSFAWNPSKAFGMGGR